LPPIINQGRSLVLFHEEDRIPFAKPPCQNRGQVESEELLIDLLEVLIDLLEVLIDLLRLRIAIKVRIETNGD
jgi:hypothetical protein